MSRSDNLEIGSPGDEAEFKAFTDIVSHSLFFPDAAHDQWLEREGEKNVRVARRKGKVVGGLTAQTMGQWFGGQSVPMAGIRAVGVSSEHRSTGVATALVRAALREMYEKGIPLSVLYPATQPVYRRPGFEQAGVRLTYQMLAGAIDFRDRTLEVRTAEESDQEVIRELYRVRAQRTSGNLDRSEWLWQRVVDPPSWFKPVKIYVLEKDGVAEGYTVVSQKIGERPDHRNHLELADVVAMTPNAGRRLLAFFGDHRSMVETITWSGPPADPWLFLPSEQVGKIVRRIDWMLRVVNVKTALESRGYAPSLTTEVHLEIEDDVLPENNGRWVLSVADGGGQVTEGGRGDVRLDVRGLATLYTSHLSPLELRATGYIDGPDDVLTRLGSVLAGPAPWMPDMF